MCRALVHILSECTFTRITGTLSIYYATQLSNGIERNNTSDDFLLWCSNLWWELRIKLCTMNIQESGERLET